MQSHWKTDYTFDIYEIKRDPENLLIHITVNVEYASDLYKINEILKKNRKYLYNVTVSFTCNPSTTLLMMYGTRISVYMA